MRTIKFRGKSKRDGEWFYGNLYDKDTNGNTHICTLKKGCLVIDPDTVGQFTGLHDKNGKEIYEGDVLKIFYNGKSKVFGVVRWGETRFFIDDNFLKGKFTSKAPMSEMFKHYGFEVVGNCHDNPELLTT